MVTSLVYTEFPTEDQKKEQPLTLQDQLLFSSMACCAQVLIGWLILEMKVLGSYWLTQALTCGWGIAGVIPIQKHMCPYQLILMHFGSSGDFL